MIEPRTWLNEEESTVLECWLNEGERSIRKTAKALDMEPADLYHIFARPHVINARDVRLAHFRDEMGINEIRVLQEYARIAFFDARNLFRPDGKLKQPREWDDATAGAIQSIEYDTKAKTTKLKLNPKLPALDSIAKHLGMLKPDGTTAVQINSAGDNSHFTISFVKP